MDNRNRMSIAQAGSQSQIQNTHHHALFNQPTNDGARRASETERKSSQKEACGETEMGFRNVDGEGDGEEVFIHEEKETWEQANKAGGKEKACMRYKYRVKVRTVVYTGVVERDVGKVGEVRDVGDVSGVQGVD
ncbi:hypothetical protein EVG20_g8186 [Dentipellis fragilis]|uniref:Uncharacterized protein n=1 Tax=Dentipellis fragilis TaxID=205917 RepID=A0A4Y9Y847_9AGAM|nr:hypothetical protein EVG20_g8186 [Dentipellis fragilis]